MACLRLYLIISHSLHFILFMNLTVQCYANEEDNLLLGISMYRASLNLTGLMENDRAECLAEEIADLFENQPCTNTGGPNTVPGTEPQFSDYPNLLVKCNLSPEGIILPACVPSLVPTLVLSNFTQSRYSNYLNDSKFSGAGVGSEDDWIVVVLTTNTPAGAGGLMTGTSHGLVLKVGLIYCHFLMFFLWILCC